MSEQARSKRWVEGNREEAGLALLNARRATDGVVQFRESPARPLEKAPARERRLHTRAVPLEQCDAELLFERTQPAAHGRGLQSEPPGCAPDAEILGDEQGLID